MPHVLYGCSDYEWDYEKEADENYTAQEEFHTKQRELQEEQSQKEDQQAEDLWQKQMDDDRKRMESQMFKTKLMMPLYAKKIAKVSAPFLRDCWSYDVLHS